MHSRCLFSVGEVREGSSCLLVVLIRAFRPYSVKVVLSLFISQHDDGKKLKINGKRHQKRCWTAPIIPL